MPNGDGLIRMNEIERKRLGFVYAVRVVTLLSLGQT